MPDEQKTQLRLEIAHVLFMDIVGYSRLLIDEQSEALQELNEIVRKTEAARTAARWKIQWNARSRSVRGCARNQVCRCGWAFTAVRCITSPM